MADENYYSSPSYFNDSATFFGDVTIYGKLNYDITSINSLYVPNGATIEQVGGASTALVVNGNSYFSGISTISLGSTSSPQYNSHMSFELTSNTNLRVKVRGSDGVLRSGNIILA